MLESVIMVFAYLDRNAALPFPHPFPGATRGAVWASLACGLQNALTTHFSSAVVRTTHVTGLLTDVGIILGRWIIRGDTSLVWRLWVRLFIFGASTYGKLTFKIILPSVCFRFSVRYG
jgi:uncharacterized membrane protein YoaK (UPF0700 family)